MVGDRRRPDGRLGGAASDRPDALAQLYGPTNATGARLNLLRLPLTATDFSPSLWTWGWDGMAANPSPQARAAVRLLKGPIRGLQPRLRVVGAPWTLPIG